MKITLDEWRSINKEITEASAALKKAESQIIETVKRHQDQGNMDECVLLLELFGNISENGPHGWSYMTHPQEEWLGGDSTNPENFTVREPNIVPHPKRFPQQQ